MRRAADEVGLAVAQRLVALADRIDQLKLRIEAFLLEEAHLHRGDRGEVRVGDEIGNDDFHGTLLLAFVRQRHDLVAVRELAAQHRVLQLHVERAGICKSRRAPRRCRRTSRCSAPAPPCRSSARSDRSACACRPACLPDRPERGGRRWWREREAANWSQWASDIVEQPGIAADRFGAELLGERDPHRLGLAVGVVGTDREPQFAAMRSPPPARPRPGLSGPSTSTILKLVLR